MMNSHSHQHEAQQQQMHPMQPLQKLPKINIYINNSQIKKLLGKCAFQNYQVPILNLIDSHLLAQCNRLPVVVELLQLSLLLGSVDCRGKLLS